MVLSSSLTSQVFSIAAKIVVVFFCMPLHNILQAYAANAFGDSTAIRRGYDNFDLRYHLDARGVLALLLYNFGWTKPVPRRFNNDNCKHPTLAKVVTALVGPLFYFFAAFVFLVLYRISDPNMTFMFSQEQNVPTFFMNISMFLTFLGTANLIPFYPFDCSEILEVFISGKIQRKISAFFQKYEGIVTIVAFIVLLPLIMLVLQSISFSVFSKFNQLVTLIQSLFYR